MSWWDNFFAGNWNRDKQIDPLGHSLIEGVVRQDSHNLGVGTGYLSGLMGGNKTLVGHWMNDIHNEAGRNEQNPVRGAGRAALTAGAIFGGMAGAGALGGSGAAGAGAGDAAAAGAGGDAMGGAAGTLGAADSAASGYGFTAAAPGAVDLGTAGGVTGTASAGDAMGGSAGTLGAADSQAANSSLGLGANTGGVPSQVNVDGTTYNTAGSGMDWDRMLRSGQQGMQRNGSSRMPYQMYDPMLDQRPSSLQLANAQQPRMISYAAPRNPYVVGLMG
jgi:hypothetical protein